MGIYTTWGKVGMVIVVLLCYGIFGTMMVHTIAQPPEIMNPGHLAVSALLTGLMGGLLILVSITPAFDPEAPRDYPDPAEDY